MTYLTSRPEYIHAPTNEEIAVAAAPAINLLTWLSSMLAFSSNDMHMPHQAKKIITDALDCLNLPDYSVVHKTGAVDWLNFSVALKPLHGGGFYVFTASFRVRI